MPNAAEYRTAMLGRRREAVDARLPHGGQAINYGYHLRAVIDAAWLRDWQFPAEHGDLHELVDGGHHFLRTRPTEAAQAALRAAELLAPIFPSRVGVMVGEVRNLKSVTSQGFWSRTVVGA